MSRGDRLARLEEARPVDDDGLCLRCVSLVNAEEFRRRMRELGDRAKTMTPLSDRMTGEEIREYLAEVRRRTPPCPRCGSQYGTGRTP
jgi:hypothetical protein